MLLTNVELYKIGCYVPRKLSHHILTMIFLVKKVQNVMEMNELLLGRGHTSVYNNLTYRSPLAGKIISKHVPSFGTLFAIILPL